MPTALFLENPMPEMIEFSVTLPADAWYAVLKLIGLALKDAEERKRPQTYARGLLQKANTTIDDAMATALRGMKTTEPQTQKG